MMFAITILLLSAQIGTILKIWRLGKFGMERGITTRRYLQMWYVGSWMASLGFGLANWVYTYGNLRVSVQTD